MSTNTSENEDLKPLIAAAERRHVGVVRASLNDSIVDENVGTLVDGLVSALIMGASYYGYLDIAKMLAKHGANVELCSIYLQRRAFALGMNACIVTLR